MMSKPIPGRSSSVLPNTVVRTVFRAHSIGTHSIEVERRDDGYSASALEWISPAPSDAFVSGGKLVATWFTPSGHVVSPSFQLCLVETGECGDTVWPNVKKLSNNQYTITMKIPDLGSDNKFFIRMEDNHGRAYDTPEFTLQATSTDSSTNNKSSSSALPDSQAGSNTAGISIIGSEGSKPGPSGTSSEGKPGSSSWGADGDDKRRPQAEDEGKETPMKASGNSPNNSNSTIPSISSSTNATSTVAPNPISSLASAPSVTNNALVGTSGGNKPSTTAIVVPLALFAAALVGLIFSLRQRSKSKEKQAKIQAPTNSGREEPALKQVTTRESFASGSSGNSGTDLERAMEFITRVKAVDSPRLTQLPQDIEAKRRVRRERRMREAQQISGVENGSLEQRNVPVSSSAPNLQRCTHQDITPIVRDPAPRAQSSAPSAVPAPEVPQTVPYAVYQAGPPGVPPDSTYQLPPMLRAEPLPAIDPLAYVTLARSGAPQTMVTPPATESPLATMPRLALFAQQQALPASVSLPVQTPIDRGHNLPSASATVLAEAHLASDHPSSLQVAQPQAPMVPPPQAIYHCEPPFPRSRAQDTQPQPQRIPSTSFSTGPEIPYSTRPQPQPQPQAHGMPNPYEAIVKALGTPRPG